MHKKTIFRAFAGFLPLWILIPFLQGCAYKGIDLIETKRAQVEKRDSKYVTITRLEVYQDGDMLNISGAVKRKERFGPKIRGHLDISILFPDGSTLEEFSLYHNPRLLIKKKNRLASEGIFGARLNLRPPEGFFIVAAYHNPFGMNNDMFECDSNIAGEALRADGKPVVENND